MSQLHQATCRAQEFFARNSPGLHFRRERTHQSTCSAPRLHQAFPWPRCEPSHFRHCKPSRSPYGLIKTHLGSFEPDLERPRAVRFLEPGLISLWPFKTCSTPPWPVKLLLGLFEPELDSPTSHLGLIPPFSALTSHNRTGCWYLRERLNREKNFFLVLVFKWVSVK